MRTTRVAVSLVVPSRERKVRKHTHTHTNTPSISRIRRAHRLTSRHPPRTPRAPRAIDDARAALGARHLHIPPSRHRAVRDARNARARTRAMRDETYRSHASRLDRGRTMFAARCGSERRIASARPGSRPGRAQPSRQNPNVLHWWRHPRVSDRPRAGVQTAVASRAASRAVGVTAPYARATRGAESFACRRLAMPRGRS